MGIAVKLAGLPDPANSHTLMVQTQAKQENLMAKITLTESIDVGCPVEDAFALLADINRHLDIFSQNKEIRDFHGGPVQEGDSWVIVSSFMGREVVTTYTMKEVIPNSKLVFGQSSSSAEGQIAWEFEAIDGGTRITTTGEGDPKGFFATVASQLLRSTAENQLRGDMATVKGILEA